MLRLGELHSRWVVAGSLLLAVVAGCSDDDGDSSATTEVQPSGPVSAVAATDSPASATSAPATPTAPSFTTPATVITDTEAVGGSTISVVDPATGAATVLGGVGGELGLLGLAASPTGEVHAVTDAPAVVAVDPDDPAASGAGTPIAAGTTLLALAARPDDGTLIAIDDAGAIVELDPSTGATTPVGEVALADPGVGLDIADDGTLEVVVATGERWSVDLTDGAAAPLPRIVGARIVAVARTDGERFGIDASADALVSIEDDGTVAAIGALDLDATDGASLAVDADGRLLLANPG